MKRILIIAVLAVAVNVVACNDKKTDGVSNNATDVTEVDNTTVVTPEPSANAETKSVTVKGIVIKVEHGKDGYTAQIKDGDGQYYFVTVSRANLAEPGDYREVNVNDEITASGEQWEMNGEVHIKAISIII